MLKLLRPAFSQRVVVGFLDADAVVGRDGRRLVQFLVRTVPGRPRLERGLAVDVREDVRREVRPDRVLDDLRLAGGVGLRDLRTQLDAVPPVAGYEPHQSPFRGPGPGEVCAWLPALPSDVAPFVYE